jgi:DNA ligase-associated metallophosphoesterase
MQAVEFAGETLLLLAERALWWPRAQILVLADPHFGKDASFRAAGIAVPAANTEETLLRLQTLLQRWPVRDLVILGDFFHCARSQSSSTLQALRLWHTKQRQANPEFRWHLVLGNHDHHAGLAPADLELEIHTDPWFCSPWTFRHLPDTSADGFTLCGHLHPVVRLKQGKIDNLRLPCFWFQKQTAVLPAFGAFTGGHEIELARLGTEDQIWVIAGEKVGYLTQKKRKSGTI